MAFRKKGDNRPNGSGSGEQGRKVTFTGVKMGSRWSSVRQVGRLSNAFATSLTVQRQQAKEYGQQVQQTDNVPRRGGVNVFGLNKHGMTRAVHIFSEKPKPRPFTVCFYFPSTILTHKVVLSAIKDKLYYLHDAVVRQLQFEELNVLHGARGLENRWLITVNMMEARDELLRVGLYLYGKRMKVKKYDDVQKEEWEEYLKYRQIQKALCLTQNANKDASNSDDSGGEAEPETQIGSEEGAEENKGGQE